MSDIDEDPISALLEEDRRFRFPSFDHDGARAMGLRMHHLAAELNLSIAVSVSVSVWLG